MKLSVDELELISEFIQSPTLPILFKITDDILSTLQDRLINTPLTVSNEREILISKARIDGASVLIEALRQRLSKKNKP